MADVTGSGGPGAEGRGRAARGGPARPWLATHAVVRVLLVGALVGLVGWLGARHYARWDWTRAKLFSLSGKTRQVVQGLTEPVTVTVVFQSGHQLHDPVRRLLREYERAGSGKVTVEWVDPDRDLARVRQLAAALRLQALNVIVVSQGDRHKHLAGQDLAEVSGGDPFRGLPPDLTAFTAESAITAAILTVTQEVPPQVWWVGGHGEKRVADLGGTGASEAATALRNDNFVVEDLALLGLAELTPASHPQLVVAGPARPFAEQELALLARYLAAGGRAVILLDPLTTTGLETLLGTYGIQVGHDIVVDPARRLPLVSASNLFVMEYLPHEITGSLEGMATLFPLARSVSPSPAAAQLGYQVTALAQTSEQGWGEVTLADGAAAFDPAVDLQGPVTIAVAATPAAGGAAEMRLVVIGDSEFIVNGQFTNLGNGDLFRNAVNWLADRKPLLAISPKQPESMRLSLSAGQMRTMVLEVLVGVPALWLAVGGVVWWRRSRV